jgi:isopentenyl-diphosphate Delta-isomerase
LVSDEEIDVVDESDRVLRVASLARCKKEGLLHRSVAVFVRNTPGEILLQRRSIDDDWLPGKWTVSSTGHVRAKEEPVLAATREAEEELGIETQPVFLFRELLPAFHWLDSTEHEIAYTYEAVWDGKIQFDRSEVDQVKFFSPGSCRSFIDERSDEFTPDAVILLRKYLRIKNSNR